jgi:hypothetical protein
MEKYEIKAVVREGHNNLVFAKPVKTGCYNWLKGKQAIEEAGLKPASLSELITLFSWARDNRYSENDVAKEVISLVNEVGFWAYTGTLCLPAKNGRLDKFVVIEDNPITEGNRIFMDSSCLLEKIKKEDPSVRSLPLYLAGPRQQDSRRAIEFPTNYLTALARSKEQARTLASFLYSQGWSQLTISLPESFEEEETFGTAIAPNGWSFGVGCCDPTNYHGREAWGLVKI